MRQKAEMRVSWKAREESFKMGESDATKSSDEARIKMAPRSWQCNGKSLVNTNFGGLGDPGDELFTVEQGSPKVPKLSISMAPTQVSHHFCQSYHGRWSDAPFPEGEEVGEQSPLSPLAPDGGPCSTSPSIFQFSTWMKLDICTESSLLSISITNLEKRIMRRSTWDQHEYSSTAHW